MELIRAHQSGCVSIIWILLLSLISWSTCYVIHFGPQAVNNPNILRPFHANEKLEEYKCGIRGCSFQKQVFMKETCSTRKYTFDRRKANQNGLLRRAMLNEDRCIKVTSSLRRNGLSLRGKLDDGDEVTPVSKH